MKRAAGGAMPGMGRSSTFSQAIADAICERLAMGESLRSVCRDDGMPPEATVRGWVIDDVQGFAAQYTRSRDFGLDAMADEVLDVADDGRNDWIERETAKGGTYVALNDEAVSRSKLRVDARKWYLSKLAPKRYGETSKVELSGPNGGPIELSESERSARVAGLLALAIHRADHDPDGLT